VKELNLRNRKRRVLSKPVRPRPLLIGGNIERG
jgi:hypothetical protein